MAAFLLSALVLFAIECLELPVPPFRSDEAKEEAVYLGFASDKIDVIKPSIKPNVKPPADNIASFFDRTNGEFSFKFLHLCSTQTWHHIFLWDMQNHAVNWNLWRFFRHFHSATCFENKTGTLSVISKIIFDGDSRFRDFMGVSAKQFSGINKIANGIVLNDY